jgi:hypothetical protein
VRRKAEDSREGSEYVTQSRKPETSFFRLQVRNMKTLTTIPATIAALCSLLSASYAFAQVSCTTAHPAMCHYPSGYCSTASQCEVSISNGYCSGPGAKGYACGTWTDSTRHCKDDDCVSNTCTIDLGTNVYFAPPPLNAKNYACASCP